MHPAPSIIIFTVASGTGYGLIAIALFSLLFGLLPWSASFAWSSLLIGSLLVIIGLCSSTFHLGRPERAWRALSQWRSSWLSREGVMAVLTFGPIGLTGLGWLMGGEWWIFPAYLAVLGSIVTVYCTAMIYASLKPIPAWHNDLVPVGYIALALAGGGVTAVLLAAATGVLSTSLTIVVALFVLAAGILKLRYWRMIAEQPLPSTTAGALGLGDFGKATLLELPHSSKNYLQREFHFEIARKHADKLRNIALFAGAATLLILLASLTLPSIGAAALLVIAFALIGTSLLVERWLFFAEARHTVTLYYGNNQ